MSNRITLTPEADAPARDEKPFVSAGKHIHNELTYRGVDFLLNSAIGVAFTYWTARTRSGEKYFGRPVGNFFKAALRPVLKSPEALEEGAKWGTMFTSIIVGGTTIIAPMTYLEHRPRKVGMIRWCDEKVYGEERVENDPRFAQLYEAIENEPKKNFAQGMAARFIVLTPMIAATMNPATNKVMVKYLYNPIGNGSKWLCRKAGIQPKRLMRQGRVELADGDLSKAPKFLSDWDFIHRTVGFDLGLTFIYSFAHEATIKTLAAMGFGNAEASAHVAQAVAGPQLQREAEVLAPTPEREGLKRPRPARRTQFTDYVCRSEQEAQCSL